MVQARRSLGWYYIRAVHGKYMTSMGEHSNVANFFSLGLLGGPRWVMHCADSTRHEGHHNWKVLQLFETDVPGRVALKSCHDRWLSARDCGDVTNEADRVDWWETFEMVSVQHPTTHTIALRSVHDAKLLIAYPDGRLRADSRYNNDELNGGHWEAFVLEPVQAINMSADFAFGGGHLSQRFVADQANLLLNELRSLGADLGSGLDIVRGVISLYAKR